jgi:hypothetical protein
MDNALNGVQGGVALTTVRSNIFFGTGQTQPSANGNDMSLTAAAYEVAFNRTYNKWETDGGRVLITDTSPVISNNTFVGSIPIRFGSCTSATLLGNVLVMNASGANYPILERPVHDGSWVVNNNNYFARTPRTVKFDTNNLTLTFSQWKATYSGFDTTSTATDASLPPDAVYVIPNQDEARRAHIAVYNWSGADNVAVNVSGILVAGDVFYLYSAQNFNGGAIKSGIYDGASISVPITNLAVAPILYNTNTYYGELISPPATSPEFGAFVLLGAFSGNVANVGTLNLR